MVKRRTIRRVKRIANMFSSTSKLNSFALGNSLGIVSAIMIAFYAVMVWFGGFNGNIIIQQYPLGFSFNDWTLLIGLIETYAMGYILGWILAKVYNKSLKG